MIGERSLKMIIADKILYLRKKNNLTQEELAEKLNVSRQSISKWESATSIPDITKIMDMAHFFSVSTDYLLKDEIEYPESEGTVEPPSEHLVLIEEANSFISTTRKYGKKVAKGVFICIISPIVLIFLSVATEKGQWYGLSEAAGIGIGLVFLFVSVAIAVAIFITAGQLIKPHAFLREGAFELSFGVSSVIKEQQNAFSPRRTRTLITSIFMFIGAPLPLILVSLLGFNDVMMTAMLVVLLIVVAIGVYNLIVCETQKDSYEMLLGEGEYKIKNQGAFNMSEYKKKERIGGIYWPIIVALYLGISFFTEAWGISWIIWPIAALLFSAIMAFMSKE